MTANDTIRVGIIMAGGSGERFWPLSRRRRPKQLLRLTDPDKTLLHEAVERVAPLIPPERIFIVTGEHLVEPIQAAGIGTPPENVIAEPCKRNTSGALAYAAAYALARYDAPPDRITMAITTADHNIGDPGRFQETVSATLDLIEHDALLATLGIVPTRPETGYGYIQIADGAASLAEGDVSIYPVNAFHEKPNRQKAREFMNSGRYFWNSGMFFWRISAFLDELESARPALAEAVRRMSAAMEKDDRTAVRGIFEGLEDISIDYALMEHAKRAVVAKAEFPWDDIGSWPALDRTLAHDENGNVAVGDPVMLDCEDCIVYNDAGAAEMAVSVIGCEDLIVATTPDGVLVAPKERAQDIRRAVRELRERGSDHV